jgi:hypothetical protein
MGAVWCLGAITRWCKLHSCSAPGLGCDWRCLALELSRALSEPNFTRAEHMIILIRTVWRLGLSH